MALLHGESRLTLRLFLDNTIAETYWQDRGAMTMPFNATAAPSSALTLEVAGLRANVTTWSVGSIWVTPEQVIDGARASGG